MHCAGGSSLPSCCLSLNGPPLVCRIPCTMMLSMRTESCGIGLFRFFAHSVDQFSRCKCACFDLWNVDMRQWVHLLHNLPSLSYMRVEQAPGSYVRKLAVDRYVPARAYLGDFFIFFESFPESRHIHNLEGILERVAQIRCGLAHPIVLEDFQATSTRSAIRTFSKSVSLTGNAPKQPA